MVISLHKNIIYLPKIFCIYNIFTSSIYKFNLTYYFVFGSSSSIANLHSRPVIFVCSSVKTP